MRKLSSLYLIKWQKERKCLYWREISGLISPLFCEHVQEIKACILYVNDLISFIDQKWKSFFAVRSQAKRAKLEEHKGSIGMVDQNIEDQNIMLEAEIVELKRRLEEYQKSCIEGKENQEKLAYLFDIGYIYKNEKPAQN